MNLILIKTIFILLVYCCCCYYYSMLRQAWTWQTKSTYVVAAACQIVEWNIMAAAVAIIVEKSFNKWRRFIKRKRKNSFISWKWLLLFCESFFSEYAFRQIIKCGSNWFEYVIWRCKTAFVLVLYFVFFSVVVLFSFDFMPFQFLVFALNLRFVSLVDRKCCVRCAWQNVRCEVSMSQRGRPCTSETAKESEQKNCNEIEMSHNLSRFSFSASNILHSCKWVNANARFFTCAMVCRCG